MKKKILFILPILLFMVIAMPVHAEVNGNPKEITICSSCEYTEFGDVLRDAEGGYFDDDYSNLVINLNSDNGTLYNFYNSQPEYFISMPIEIKVTNKTDEPITLTGTEGENGIAEIRTTKPIEITGDSIQLVNMKIRFKNLENGASGLLLSGEEKYTGNVTIQNETNITCATKNYGIYIDKSMASITDTTIKGFTAAVTDLEGYAYIDASDLSDNEFSMFSINRGDSYYQMVDTKLTSIYSTAWLSLENIDFTNLKLKQVDPSTFNEDISNACQDLNKSYIYQASDAGRAIYAYKELSYNIDNTSKVSIASLLSEFTEDTVTFNEDEIYLDGPGFINGDFLEFEDSGLLTFAIDKTNDDYNGIIYYFDIELTENPLSFKDVPKGSWFYKPIKQAVQMNIISGYSNDRFAPQDKVTRGQMVTILYSLSGKPNVSGLNNRFSDVPEGKYYSDAVKWAAANNIVSGYGGSSNFGPMDPIIRQDLAVILNNYAKNYKHFTIDDNWDITGFVDYNKVKGKYAENALKWAVKNHVMSGQNLGDGKRAIAPFNNTTRAEATTMIINYKNAFE